jgi:DNA-directed RNA polymerase specialized sigma24 family protein
MISDDLVRGIALFFLFSLMDEKAALLAAQKVVATLKAQQKPREKSDSSESASRVALIKILRKTFEQQRKLQPRNRPTAPPSEAWVLPPELADVKPWQKFQKDAADVEIVAVVLSRILGMTDHEIAEGLNISLGTARYRVGKGMRHLGSSLRARS